jgi:hypothetical protein
VRDDCDLASEAATGKATRGPCRGGDASDGAAACYRGVRAVFVAVEPVRHRRSGHRDVGQTAYGPAKFIRQGDAAGRYFP